MPARLQRRPKDPRGLPIPWNIELDKDGRPDFRVTNQARWAEAVKRRICPLCAEPLGRHLAFVGGPLSHQSRLFTDLPMHKDCATYALQVCPFLAAPNFRYAEDLARIQLRHDVEVSLSEAVSSQRPERFFLATTRSYRLVRGPDGALYAQAAPWESTQWWRHGELLEHEAPA